MRWRILQSRGWRDRRVTHDRLDQTSQQSTFTLTGLANEITDGKIAQEKRRDKETTNGTPPAPYGREAVGNF